MHTHLGRHGTLGRNTHICAPTLMTHLRDESTLRTARDGCDSSVNAPARMHAAQADRVHATFSAYCSSMYAHRHRNAQLRERTHLRKNADTLRENAHTCARTHTPACFETKRTCMHDDTRVCTMAFLQERACMHACIHRYEIGKLMVQSEFAAMFVCVVMAICFLVTGCVLSNWCRYVKRHASRNLQTWILTCVWTCA